MQLVHVALCLLAIEGLLAIESSLEEEAGAWG